MHDHRIGGFKGKFGVLVCSSTRNADNDEAGQTIMSLLRNSGHEVSGYKVVKDDPELIKRNVLEFLQTSDAVVISGGTGITKHDITTDTVSSIAEYELKGFGHVFALLSYEEIGTSAVLSRASAYVVNRKPVFCLPGSPRGAGMGINKIILKEIDHIHHELNR